VKQKFLKENSAQAKEEQERRKDRNIHFSTGHIQGNTIQGNAIRKCNEQDG
jgi:hypothetical protein